MTPANLTDTEINRRLALAIGYRPEDVRQTLGRMVIVNRPSEVKSEFWAPFDHTEWETIGPIAERYNLFPDRLTDGAWFCSFYTLPAGSSSRRRHAIYATTPQQCIALAAITKLEKS